jgi:hypothetical protein
MQSHGWEFRFLKAVPRLPGPQPDALVLGVTVAAVTVAIVVQLPVTVQTVEEAVVAKKTGRGLARILIND